MQQGRTAAAASYPAGADKPKLIISYDHRPSLSQLAWESDKENCSPDEDGNPRPFRRTLSNHTTASGRRRLPTAAPSSSSNWADKTGGRNPPPRLPHPQRHLPFILVYVLEAIPDDDHDHGGEKTSLAQQVDAHLRR
jgi:hypothetical protein